MSVRTKFFALLAVFALQPSLGVQAGSVGASPPGQQCGAPIAGTVETGPLPNTRRVLQDLKRIKILAIGAPSVDGADDDRLSLEETLERGVKGVKAEVVNLGISGELARDAAARIKIEVALNAPNLVLWQVGTSDALARVSREDFEITLRQTLRWLKHRNVDVILVGAKYSRVLQRDGAYQALRTTVFRVAADENVMRISQYRAMEAMEKAWIGSSGPVNAYELSDDVYPCVAQYIAQAVIASVFDTKPDARGVR